MGLTWHKALAQDERMGMKKLEVPPMSENEKARGLLGEDAKEKGPIEFWNCVGGELLLLLPFLTSVFCLCKCIT